MQELKRNKLRTDYGNKTGDKIRTEHFITYNHDYVHWLEDELLKLLNIGVVSKHRELLIAFMNRDWHEDDVIDSDEKIVDRYLKSNL